MWMSVQVSRYKPVISARAIALFEALDEQAWKGPGYLDIRRKQEIIQAALDAERAEILQAPCGDLEHCEGCNPQPRTFWFDHVPVSQADGTWDDPQGEQ